METIQALAIAAISAAGAVIALLIAFVARITVTTKKLLAAIKETYKPIATAYEGLKEDLRDTQNAIILAQSKDADARKAVVELLSKAKGETLAKAAQAIKDEIEKEVSGKKEILKKVASDYTPVD